MAEQRVVLTLVAADAGLTPTVAAATAEVTKLQAAVDKLAAASGAVGAGTDKASAGAARLGESSAVASREVKALGDSATVSGEKLTLLGAGAEVSGGKVASAMRLAAKSLPLVGIVAVAEFAKMAGDFQQHTNVLVTAAGESQGALAGVRKGILDIAQSTGTRWQDLTDGMYQIEKAGYRGADGLKILKASAQAAREEGANLATVTAATTSVMASYHLGAGDAVSVTNQIKTAAGEAKTTMESFAGSLSTVLPLASANHISFADVAGSLASLTQHGTTADEAAQELAFTIRGLSAPNNVAVQTMGQLGVASTDVAQRLGDKSPSNPDGRGLAGTLNYLSETVLSKMGPSGLILLNTFKTSTTASKDLATMLDAMAPATRKVAEEFLHGTLDSHNFGVAVKGMTGDQAVLARQFATTYSRANGFNDALKRGGADAVTYSDQIKKITGGAAGLNTVLQLTGDSAAGTTERIARIAAAAVGAGDDVSGWSSTQGLFNVKVAEFNQTLQAAAITLGEKLLPPLGAVFGLVGSNKLVLEGIAVALGGFTAAMVLNTTVTFLNAQARAIWATGVSVGTKVMALARGEETLFTLALSLETRAKIASTVAGLQMNAAMVATAPATAIASGAVLGLGRGLGLLGSAVGLAARAAIPATVAYYGISLAGDKISSSMEKAHTSVQTFAEDLVSAGNGTGSAGLTRDLNGLGESIKTLNTNADRSLGNQAMQLFFGNPFQGKAGLADARAQIGGLDEALTGLVKSGHADEAAHAFQVIAAQASAQGVSMQDLTSKFTSYNKALADLGPGAGTATSDEGRLLTATKNLAAAQDSLNTETQKSIDQFTILNQGALTQERANEALVSKTNALTDAVKANGTSLSLTSAAGISNRQAVVDLMQASNDKIAADFKAKAATDGTTVALQEMTKQVEDNRTSLIKQMVQAGFTQAAAKAMADQFLLTPQQIDTQFKTPGMAEAQANVKALQDTINGLNDKDLHINAYLAAFTSQDQYAAAGNAGNRSQAAKLNNNAASGGSATGYANGGPVPLLPGATAGKDSVAAMLMPHEFVVRADGSNLGDAIAHYGRRMAAGGPVITDTGRAYGSQSAVAGLVGGLNADVQHLATMAQAQAQAAMAAAAMAMGAGSAAIGSWSGQQGGLSPDAARGAAQNMLPAGWDMGALIKLWNQESGWRWNANNPSSGAYGIPQSLPANKMASAGGDYLTNAITQIRWGLGYIGGRYGNPQNAWAHEQQMNWYQDGTRYVPTTGPAVLHQGERVIPAEQNRQLSRWLTASNSGAGAAQAGPTSVRVFIGDRELTDMVRVEVDSTIGQHDRAARLALGPA